MENINDVVVLDSRQSYLFSSQNSENMIQKSVQTVSYNVYGANTKNNSQLSWNIIVPKHF